MNEKTASPSSQEILTALEKAIKKIEALEGQHREPIAVIGLSGRFPGADDPNASSDQRMEAFWRLLHEGIDGISEVPAERWDVEDFYSADRDDKTKMYTRHMGTIAGVADFDAGFFGISPREAMRMDPQQRLLLETCWEALEHAGLAPDKLRKTQTGVFMGLCNNDYRLLHGSDDSTQQDYLLNLGTDDSIGVGRISHVLGSQGPTLLVNTSCSTSLVTIHLACQSLRNHESSIALAGGVNLILSPQSTISACRHHALSADGRCKTFDAAADGYVRGEGCGVVVLRRLQDALASGDNILAVIQGSGINHDGASNSLTTPNPQAQSQLISQTLKRARVRADAISYIEAHGTGTALGDPLEIEALDTVFANRTKPLWIGTLKTNVGHLEGAAGVAGFIKTVLMLQHGEIPPHLHFNTPSPHIDWQGLPFRIPAKPQPWPAPRIAGVSAFGFSGVNAHVLLTDAPATNSEVSGPGVGDHRVHTDSGWQLLTLSGRSEQALRDLIERYQAFLTRTDASLADLCYTATTGRNHFAHRVALSASTIHEMQAQLDALGRGESTQGCAQGHAPDYQKPPRIAFLYTGQGSQKIGMGRQLYETAPVFRKSLEECDKYLRRYEVPLLSILYPEDEDPRIDQTRFTQPALFALEYALTRLWRSWGVEPDAVMGHSVGEYVAACVAGVFSLEDALQLIAARGRLMGALPDCGVMVAVMAEYAEVAAALVPVANQVSIAAINGPRNLVISGKRAAVWTVSEQLAAKGIKTRQLRVSHAFHSPLMEPMLEEFRQVAESITYRKPDLALVSNLSGALASDEVTTPDYWVRHVRETVRFADGMQELARQGTDIFLEIGPNTNLLASTLMHPPVPDAAYLASLRTKLDDWQSMLASLGELYARGVGVNWEALYAKGQRRKVVLPTYPFQRQRYWLDSARYAARGAKPLSRLIDRSIRVPRNKALIYETDFSVTRLPFLADHVIFGKMVSSGTCQLATTLEAARLAHPHQTLALANVVLPQALVFADERDERRIQVVFDLTSASEGTGTPFELCSFQPHQEDEDLRSHATGLLRVTPPTRPPAIDIAAVRARCREKFDLKRIEAFWQASQFQFGPSYLWLEQIWYGEEEVIGRLLLPDAVDPQDAYQLHPGLLDASLHLTLIYRLLEKDIDALRNQRETRLPFGFDSVTLFGELSSCGEWWSHAQRIDGGRWKIQLLNGAGTPLMEVVGINERPASNQHILGAEAWQDWLYRVQWQRSACFGLPPDYLPAPSSFAPQLRSVAPGVWQSLNGDTHQELLAALEERSLGYVLSAFVKAAAENASFDFRPGRLWYKSQLARQLGVIPEYQRLLTRLLGMLTEAGYLTPTEDGWQVLKAPDLINPAQQLSALPGRFIDAHESALLPRCGERLLEVIRGEQEPLELLFPGGDTTLVTALNSASPSAEVMNRLVQQAVERVLRELPPERGLRILEVGAGTGGTTAGLLPRLPAEQTDYLFTDIGAAFLHQAEMRFSDFPFVRYQVLDIERSPLEQGFSRRQSDLILATNVLHATRYLGETLANLRQLMQSGGQLMLVEATSRRRWVDLSFGLTDGWWRFADERQTHPLLSAAQWQTCLLENGFTTVEIVEQGGQSLIIAQVGRDEEALETGAVQRENPWLIFADSQGIGKALANHLQRHGECPLLIHAGEAFEQDDNHSIFVRPDAPADYRRLLASVGGIPKIVHLWSLDTPGLEHNTNPVDAVRLGCGSVLHLAQTLLHEQIEPIALYLVTSDAQAIGQGDTLSGALQSTLAGMAKVIALEHPELHSIQVDLEGGCGIEQQAQLLFAEVTRNSAQASASDQPEERQVALRHDGRYLARLTSRQPKPEATAARPPIQAGATYLITGGLGGLGMAVAQWLAEQGARHLLLVGRSRPKPEVQAQLDALTEKGVTVTVAQADVAIHSELEAALNRIDGRYPLRGLIHSVGVLDDGTLLRLDWTRFEKILTPKMAGAWHLHHLTRQLPLDFFILFSSAASMLGSRGQANHAAANAFLDSFAHFRQAQGLPGLSINWGAWSEVGAAVSVVRSGYTAAQGFGEIEPQQGLRCLGWLLAGDAPQLGVIPIKWKQFLGATDSPFYQEFYPLLEPLGSTSGSQEPSPGLFADIRQHIASAPASDRQAILLQYLCAAVAKVLRLDPEQLDPHLGLVEMGLDSLMAIELRNRVQKELTIELPVTAYLDNSSIARIGELILADHFQSDEATLVGQGTTNRKDDSPPEPGTPPAATGKTRVRL